MALLSFAQISLEILIQWILFFISFNDGLNFKEIRFFVGEFDLFVMRLLEPMDFHLEEDAVEISLQLLPRRHDKDNQLSLGSYFNVFFSTKDTAEDTRVKGGGIFLHFR